MKLPKQFQGLLVAFSTNASGATVRLSGHSPIRKCVTASVEYANLTGKPVCVMCGKAYTICLPNQQSEKFHQDNFDKSMDERFKDMQKEFNENPEGWCDRNGIE